ncbi:MAG TPA: Holliday junction resolvase RuvX [Chloroflexota bacterium]|jgi:putative Holliday junction resolvase|nr:Holliday junction resolvase RuvX [Chloroflexota bacterium]
MRSVRYLGLDVGAVWIGLALSDPTGLLASPLSTQRRTQVHGDAVRALIDEHEVAELVIGLPLNMDGSSGGQVQETYDYIASLGPLPVPVCYWDERLSSWEAEQVIAQVKGRSPRRRERLDAIAAAVMLQDFLDARRQKEQTTTRRAT